MEQKFRENRRNFHKNEIENFIKYIEIRQNFERQ